VEYSNEITIVLSVTPYQHKFWTSPSALSFCMIETPVPYRNMRIEFTPSYSQSPAKLALPLTSKYAQGSLMRVTFEYLRSIHGRGIVLSFNFSSAVDAVLSEIPPYSVSLTVNPGNNEYAHRYSQRTYDSARTLSDVALLMAAAAVGLLLLSLLLGGKRIVVEMLIVLQVTYVSLIAVPELSPLYSALTALSAANNGFNALYSASLRPFEDTLSDSRAKGAQLYSQLLFNLNAGLLFVLLPLAVALAAFVVGRAKEFSEEGRTRLEAVYRKSLGEYAFVGLLFVGCIVGASAVMEANFGMGDTSTMGGLLSAVATGGLLLLYPIYGLLRVRSPHLFGEFADELVEGRFSLAFQTAAFFLWPAMSALVCAFNYVWFINIPLMGVCFVLYCVTVVTPIFRKQIDRFRTQLNLLTIAFAQVPYLYSNVHSGYEYGDDSDLILMAPVAIGLLLFLNFIANLSYFTYEVFKKIRLYLGRKS
jgi:hypothetical protein